MSDPIKKVVGGLGVTKVLDMFKAPEMPDIPEAKVMPLADEEALAKARKRSGAKRSSGRASTVLSLGSGGGTKTLGG